MSDFKISSVAIDTIQHKASVTLITRTLEIVSVHGFSFNPPPNTPDSELQALAVEEAKGRLATALASLG